ncbi:hypothetical protein DL96DRAFT_1631102 [Flagelloscypha sp. PMI_526]|nr:hypothetical protein DL96DRAFT_1631102 [Flagelloscypha sp. PMI_526]
MSTLPFPTELLEHIASHLVDDPVALSMCCLSSPALVPVCRVARFQCVTLANPAHCGGFSRLLKTSPRSAIATHVRRLIILSPQDYETGEETNVLTDVLDHVQTSVLSLQIFSENHLCGVAWSEIDWLQTAIFKLPYLQSLETEVWGLSFSTISRWPNYSNITALGLFSFQFDREMPPNLERLKIYALRLSDIDFRSVQEYLEISLLKWLDLSGTRSVAFCMDTHRTTSTTGDWVSAILQCSRTSLEHLVLEVKEPPSGTYANFQLSDSGGCPRLKRVTFLIASIYTLVVGLGDLFLAWANILLDRCPSLQAGEIVFSLMDNRRTAPPTASLELGLLFTVVEALSVRFAACRFVFTHPYKSIQLETGEFPQSLIVESQYTYVKFWSTFYSS